MSFLDDVPEQNVFVLSNGARIHNLEELLNAISSSEESLFYNHVNNDRNDFANWIKFVIHHERLYNKIINVKERRQFIDILGIEIDYIRNPKLKETATFFSENFSSEASQANMQSKNTVLDNSSNIPETPLTANVHSSPSPTHITSTAVPEPNSNTIPSNSANPNSIPANNSNMVSNNVVSNDAADMFKPIEDEPAEHSTVNQNNHLFNSEQSSADSVDSGTAFSDFEQVLSVIIAEINNEIFSE